MRGAAGRRCPSEAACAAHGHALACMSDLAPMPPGTRTLPPLRNASSREASVGLRIIGTALLPANMDPSGETRHQRGEAVLRSGEQIPARRAASVPQPNGLRTTLFFATGTEEKLRTCVKSPHTGDPARPCKSGPWPRSSAWAPSARPSEPCRVRSRMACPRCARVIEPRRRSHEGHARRGGRARARSRPSMASDLKVSLSACELDGAGRAPAARP
jgi:hypothetical protein